MSLTAEGRRFFRAMARANGDWIAELFAGLSGDEIERLMQLLGQAKASARKAIGNGGGAMSAANPVTLPLAGYQARHVRLAVDGKVATLTLDRPEKKNPLTFESYAELVDLFRAAAKDEGRQGLRHHRRRRQFLLRRRRARDHRAAGRDGRPRSCSTSPA